MSPTEVTRIMSLYMSEDLNQDDSYFDGEKRIEVSLENENLVLKYFWDDNEDVLFPDFWGTNLTYNQLEIDPPLIASVEKKSKNNKHTVIIRCIDGTKDCVTVKQEALMWHYSSGFCDRPRAINHYDYIHLYYAPTKEHQDIIYNGIRYLLFELIRSSEETKIENPFHSINSEISTDSKKEVINLSESNGVSVLKASIGGVDRTVILDSGASDVSVPGSLEQSLLSNKVISEKDYLSPGLYRIADGSVVESKRFIVPYITIDGVTVNSVSCSTNMSEDIILLGKAFLNRFKSWKINNELNQLILEY